jgi:23S rRNA pseudouridine1911/1915/1917 synthase
VNDHGVPKIFKEYMTSDYTPPSGRPREQAEGVAVDTEIPLAFAGQRLDQVLAQLLPDYSRSRLQQWIRAGQVRVDGVASVPRAKVAGGEQVSLRVEAGAPGVNLTAQLTAQPTAEPVPLDLVYEDPHLRVINKAAGQVMHPGAGNPSGTVQNGLLFIDPALADIPRCGIVHRLDKDTTGLVVVARTLSAHKRLVEQLQARSMKRQYQALLTGELISGGRVDAPIGRHPVDRQRMAVRPGGRPAITHYRVLERFRHYTRVEVSLETGRTHQIRVHMAHIGHALWGDQVYGRRARIPPGSGSALAECLGGFRRQALHAQSLRLRHPSSGKVMEWMAPLPTDMGELLYALRLEQCGA